MLFRLSSNLEPDIPNVKASNNPNKANKEESKVELSIVFLFFFMDNLYPK
jgi:hypothetical protein